MITVERNPDPLTQWVWRFRYFSDWHALVLNSYATRERPSKRHGFKVTEFYDRLDNRRGMAESEIVLPADVLAEAKQKFTESLRVVRWSERYAQP